MRFSFLIGHKDSIDKDLFESQKNLFNSEIDIVLMDTTSLVYFGDGDKAEGILNYGYSKERRFDLKQVIIGILMTKDGLPIGHEVYPGNTNDIGAFKELIQIVKTRFKIRRVIIVCDRGMVSEDNIRTFEINGYEYVVGMRMRQLKIEDAKRILPIEERVKQEELFDGKFIIETNTKLNWKEVILAYKVLWKVEAGFRTLKSELEMGPIYHYTERRILAHIFISFLALVLKTSFHKSLLGIDKSLSPAKVLEDVKKIKATQITIKDTPIVLRTELEGDAHLAFKAVGLKIPPRILDNPNDIQENVVVRLS